MRKQMAARGPELTCSGRCVMGGIGVRNCSSRTIKLIQPDFPSGAAETGFIRCQLRYCREPFQTSQRLRVTAVTVRAAPNAQLMLVVLQSAWTWYQPTGVRSVSMPSWERMLAASLSARNSAHLSGTWAWL